MIPFYASPRKFNIEPRKGWFPTEMSLSQGSIFRFLISRGVYKDETPRVIGFNP